MNEFFKTLRHLNGAYIPAIGINTFGIFDADQDLQSGSAISSALRRLQPQLKLLEMLRVSPISNALLRAAVERKLSNLVALFDLT